MDWGIAIGVAGLVLALGGILTGYIFYKRGDKRKDLCWSIGTINLVSDYSSVLSGLRVEYRGDDVANLSVSRVVVWNNGREVIDERDLDTGGNHHLSLVTVWDAKIMHVERLQENNPANAVCVLPSIDGESARVTFRYLGYEHGAVFQVVHTGQDSNDLDLVGEVRGIDAVTRKGDVLPHSLTFRGLWRHLLSIALVFLAAFLGWRGNVDSRLVAVLTFAGFILLVFFIDAFAGYIAWRRRRLPAGLESLFRITSDFDW